MQKTMKTGWNARTLVYMAMMIAIQIVLSRFLSISLGPTLRLAFGPVATIMAGLWLGPVAGALCGLCADILGCFMQGNAINPLITAAAILWGVIPAIALWLLPAGSDKKKKVVTLIVSTALTGILSSLVLTTAGLVWMYSMNLAAVLPKRIIQACVMIPCYCILANLLYFSPLTGMMLSKSAVPGTSSCTDD